MSVLQSHFLYPSGLGREVTFRSSIWSSLKPIYKVLHSHIKWFIGMDSNLRFWTDEWISPNVATQLGIPLKEQYYLVDPISNFLFDDSWHLPNFGNDLVNSNISAISQIYSKEDICVWTKVKDGVHSVKNMYDSIRFSRSDVPWHYFKWKEFLPPSRSLICVRALLDYLPTDDKLRAKGSCFPSRCSLYEDHQEDNTHLFLRCCFSTVL